MFDQMKQLMEMKKQADRIKKELDTQQVEVNEVRGITIVIDGSQNVRSVELDEGLLVPANKAKLEADLQRSINAAVAKSQKLAAQKMRTLMPVGFPGL